MKYTHILPLLVAALIPNISIADVLEDFATIPNLGATTDVRGGLVLASDGNYYGTAGGDGTATDAGSIFKMTPAGVVTTVIQFTGNGGAAPGNSPRGRLLEGADGFLYGATSLGRANVGDPQIPSSGTIFKVSKTGVFTSLVTFVKTTTAPLPTETATTAYGASPFGDLALGTDGIIYGTTLAGGIGNHGTIWGLNPTSGAFSTVVHFGQTGVNAPDTSTAGLVRGSGNTFYGVGLSGGGSGFGCIFSFEPGVSFQVISSFTGTAAPNYGNGPASTLAFGPDGKLYGTTARGDAIVTSNGTTFRCSTSGTFEHLANLSQSSITRTEVGLTLAPDGSFYGLGRDDRKAFRMTPAGAITTIGVLPTAFMPRAPWTVGADGNLYTGVAGHIYRLRFTTPLTPFAAWKQLHLGNAAADDNADPEKDGLGALAEYGLNLLPENHDVQPAVSTFNYPEGRRIRLILQRDPAHNDITIEVLATDNLVAGPWSVIATSTLGAPFAGPGYFAGETGGSGIQTVEIRDTVNMSGQTKRFLKVRFTH